MPFERRFPSIVTGPPDRDFGIKARVQSLSLGVIVDADQTVMLGFSFE